MKQEEPKQETLEEVAERYSEHQLKGMADKTSKFECINDFIAGAKWQQQQNKNLYSEEDMKQLFKSIISEIQIRKQNIISNSNKMTTHLLEGGCIAFESCESLIKESFKQFKNK